MTVRIDPITGNFLSASGSGGGGGWRPELTPEQRALAQDKTAWILAEILHEWARNPDGGTWFTKWKLNLSPAQMRIVHRGADLGLWRKDPDKAWWKFTRQAWPWILTALALRDEWMQGEEFKKLQSSIAPPAPSPATNPATPSAP